MMRQPFYKKSHNGWYVRIGKSDVFLAKRETEAWAQYRKLIALSSSQGESATVSGVLLAYMEDLRCTVSKDRMAKIDRYVRQFIDFIGEYLEVEEMNRSHVIEWLEENKGSQDKPRYWSQSAKRDAGQIVRSAFRWAMNEGRIRRNPVASLRLEEPTPRQTLIDNEVHAKLVQACMKSNKSRSFALYLIALRSGARPQQVRDVTRANVANGGRAWVFDRHKTRKKTGAPLVVPLSPCLQTLTRILSEHRESRLFLNDRGTPWTKDSAALRLRRLRQELGITGVVSYSYRHTFATDALLANQSIATVAAMLGHKDSKMVSRVYGHLDQHSQHLLDAAAAVSANRLSSSTPRKTSS